MNKERLQQVREAILKHKERFDYKSSVNTRDHFVNRLPKAADLIAEDCGTVGCVAGFAAAVSGTNCNFWKAFDIAIEFLELTKEEENFLFYCYGGYGLPNVNYKKADYTEAIKRIDVLLEQP